MHPGSAPVGSTPVAAPAHVTVAAVATKGFRSMFAFWMGGAGIVPTGASAVPVFYIHRTVQGMS